MMLQSLRRTARSVLRGVAGGVAVLALAGCHLDMWDQPKYKTLSESAFFADGAAARPLVEGVVPFQTTTVRNPRFSGVDEEGAFIPRIPYAVNRAFLERGRERFDIFCAQCHGRTGQGNGMIVQRGMKQPPSLHDPRVKGMPHGYYFDVITNGFGVMYSHATRISPEDRWAITAYIRALQLSQDARLEDVPPDQRDALSETPAAIAEPDANGGLNDHG